MNFFEKLKSLFFWRKKSASLDEWKKLADFLGLDSRIDRDAMGEATYFACLKILSESMGKMSLKLLKYTDKSGVIAMRKHALYSVLHDRPNPYMTATTFWSTVELCRCHYGNAYVWIQGAGTVKNPYKLWILPPENVTIIYDDARKLNEKENIYYKYVAAGETYVLHNEEVLHFKSSTTFNGLVGIPVREQLASTIKNQIEGQKIISKLYESGMASQAVLNYTGSINDDNVKKLVKGISGYVKGTNSDDDGSIARIIPVPVGFSLTPISMKMTDSQFFELRQYSAGQIAAAFGIKPVQYNDLSKSSYSSHESQNLAFLVDTLLYIIKQYEEEITYKLLSQTEIKSGLHAKFNVSSLLRTDLEKQINTLSQGVANGIYTPNEARSMLDLEIKEGGDNIYFNGSNIPVHLAGIQYGSNGKEEENEGNDEQDGSS